MDFNIMASKAEVVCSPVANSTSSSRRSGVSVASWADEFVRDAGHRRQNNHYIVALFIGFDHALRDIADTIKICDRGSAEFLNE